MKEIYEDLRAGSGSKDFGFRDQIQRAGISVMNNIAEGFERFTEIEFARFLDVARGSCGEVRSMYYAAEDLGYVSSDVANTDVRRRGRFPPASRRWRLILGSKVIGKYSKVFRVKG